MTKKKIVTSMDKLTPDVLEAIYKKYPDGWANHVMRITKPNGEFFHAITVDTAEISYLVKVVVKVDSKSDLEKEEEKVEADHSDDVIANDDTGTEDDSSSMNEPVDDSSVDDDL